LERVPSELEGIYKNILARLEGRRPRNIAIGYKMLRFVLHTYRPLGVNELRQAVAMRDDLESHFSCSDEGLIVGMSERIISCAGNFLEIKARGDHGSHSSRSIVLTYPTVKRENRRSEIGWEPTIEQSIFSTMFA